MKKQSVYATNTNQVHKKLTILTAALFLAHGIIAQTKRVAVLEPASPAAAVKHIGNPPGSIVFQVQYPNPSGEKFILTIKDMEGAILYQDTYTDKNFDKKFQLPQGEAEKLRFIIKSAGTNYQQTFEVNTNTRIVENIVVKKIT